MPFPEPQSLIPHRGSVVLIDEIVATDEESIVCKKTIRESDLTYSDTGTSAGLSSDKGAAEGEHSRAGVPVWSGLEMMAQSAACFSGLEAKHKNREPQKGLFLGARRFDCHCQSFPNGQSLLISAKLSGRQVDKNQQGTAIFDCSILDAKDKTKLCEASITVFVGDIPQ